MRLRKGGLSADQLNRFREDGYVIVEDVFDPLDLDPLRAELANEIDCVAKALKAAGSLAEDHADKDFDSRLTYIHRDDPANADRIRNHLEGKGGGGYTGRGLFELITHPKLLRAVGSIVGKEIVASSAYRIRTKIPGLPKGEVPWHQDSAYFAEHCDRSLILTCWIPLLDSTLDNGCLHVLPRAHKGGIIRHHPRGHAGFLFIPEEVFQAELPDPVIAECPKGGVLFMTNLTPHCSKANTTDSVRWSVDLRYQDARVPNNAGLWPSLDDEEDLSVACYPPEADFIVQSERDPGKVIDFEGYRLRRQRFEEAGNLKGPARLRWAEKEKR